MKKAILLLLPVFLFLSGCGKNTFPISAREINDFELIRTLGVDLDGGKIKITAVGGQIADSKAGVYENTGGTVTTAVKSLRTQTEKQAYFGHLDQIILGQEAAETNLDANLDYIARESSMRLETPMYVVRGDTANKVISLLAKRELSVSDYIKTRESENSRISVSHSYTAGDLMKQLARSGSGLLPAIAVGGEKKDQINLEGFAVIKDGRLAGYLDTIEPRGANLILNNMYNDTVDLADEQGRLLSLELRRAKTKITPRFEDGELVKIDVRVELEGDAGEVQDFSGLMTEDELRRFELLLEEKALTWVQSALEKSRSLNADCFEISGAVERAAPYRWKVISKDWDRIFGSLKYDIQVNAKISRSYDVAFGSEVGG